MPVENVLGTTPAPSTPAEPQVQSAPVTTPEQTVQAPEWVKSIDPSLHNEATLHKFKSPSELAKSYIEAQKFIGSDKIAVPGKYATPEEMKKVFQKLGAPEAPEKYEVAFKDKELFSDEDNKQFKSLAHNLNLLPNQAQALAEYLEKDATDHNAKIMADYETKTTENIKNLKQEWGDKYESNVDSAKFAIKHFGGDELMTYIQNQGLSSDTQLIKFLAKVGESFRGDGLPGGTQINNSGRMTPSEAMSALDNLRMSPAAVDSNHPMHAATLRDMEKLAVQAYSESKE